MSKYDETIENTKIEEYKQRAIKELINVSNFRDWHPSHFLDTAEMTYSVALGYNWLYDYLSNEEKETIENAIIQNGLIPGIMKKYVKQFEEKENNWNPICNSSLAIGAIALLNKNQEIELNTNDIQYLFQQNYLNINKEDIVNNKYNVTLNKLCNSIINRTIDKIPLVYTEMQNGGYDEGTLYWEYGNSYLVNFLSTCNLTFNNTFRLVNDDILKNTILYPVYLTGKSSVNLTECKLYNYGDADEKIVNTSAATWLANIYYKDQELSQIINWYQENYFENQNIYQLLWQNFDYTLNNVEQDKKTEILKKISDKQYIGTEIAVLQKDILDKDGFYVAVKSGKNANTNHSDLDIGSFILDAKGTRWIEDEGREYYNVNKYWDKKYNRWTYYKKRAESHSTIILENNNDSDQKIGAECKITQFWSKDSQSGVEMDISDAYNFELDGNNKIVRRIVLDKTNNKVEIQDNIELQKEHTIYSMFNISENTEITIQDEGKIAQLKQNVLQKDGSYKEKTLKLIIKNSDYEWTTISKSPIKEELRNITKNADFKYNIAKEQEKKLCIKIKNAKKLNIIVEIQ